MTRSEPSLLNGQPIVQGRAAWRWALLLGLALGGFFDGILLHQILQWHHLLSFVPGVTSLRAQIVWDGYFHALMYVLPCVAMLGLWRSRGELCGLGSIAPALLIGFGVWHVVDAVLSHWLLGIHRVRLDSPDPLFWDLLWLGLFGIVPVLAGWWWRQKASFNAGTNAAPLILLFAVTIVSGAWAAKPPPDQPLTTIVFAPASSRRGSGQRWMRPAHSSHGRIRRWA